MKGFQPRKDGLLQVSISYLNSKYPHKQVILNTQENICLISPMNFLHELLFIWHLKNRVFARNKIC